MKRILIILAWPFVMVMGFLAWACCWCPYKLRRKRPMNKIQIWVNGGGKQDAAELARRILERLEPRQVQVIAEWEGFQHPMRARESEDGPIVEYLSDDGDWYQASPAKIATFRAGYEAGKAAR